MTTESCSSAGTAFGILFGASSGASISHFDDHLAYWIQFVGNHVTSCLSKELAEHDIAVNEWVVLSALHGDPDLPHHVLNRLLGTTRTATWKIVRRLEDRGFIHRRLRQGRARQQGLSLTALGEELVPKLAALADDNDFILFLHLPPGVHKALIGTLQAVATRHQFGFRHIPRPVKNQPVNGL
jgi:DNA-binding MarR family transcriptional regulator